MAYCTVPSSIVRIRLSSGDTAMQVISFPFSNGRVNDLLLGIKKWG
jgi:hypothetical protein